MPALKFSQLEKFMESLDADLGKPDMVSQQMLTYKIARFFDIASNASIKHLKQALVAHGFIFAYEAGWKIRANLVDRKDDPALDDMVEELAK